MSQPVLPYFIEHVMDGIVIPQTTEAGYINATAMCKVAGRDFNHYRSNSYTKEFIKQLKADTGIPIS
ncbi:MAG: KilA-N domain-containing protein [Magnetococcales bacterium]|nr:KilA-N domain-containing protein [Magnetococcales bacterium]